MGLPFKDKSIFQKKKVLFRFTAVMVAFLNFFVLVSLNACTKKEDAGGKQIIHFVTWKPNQPAAWEEILRMFHEEHPDLEVRKEIGPHSSTAFHDLLTQKLKNKSPDVDVFLMDVIWPPEFAAAGWALPLDEFFSAAEQEQFLEGTILANTYENTVYGLPLFIDSGILYYRKDLLKKYGFKPPVTWDEMNEQISRIVPGETKSGEAVYGFSGQFKQYEGLVCDMMEFILSNGGQIINPETGTSSIAEKPAVEAVKFVRDKIIGHSAPVGVLTYQEPESLDLFVQGRAVFHRNWPYAWELANSPDRSKIAGNVGIAPLPHFKGWKSYSALGGWQVGISSHSRNKEAAWKFAAFLASERVQKLLALKAGRAPTRKALYEDPEVLKANPHFADMKEVFLSAYPRPRSPLYPAISNVLQRYFSKAISDPESDIQTEAADASEEINSIIGLSQ